MRDNRRVNNINVLRLLFSHEAALQSLVSRYSTSFLASCGVRFKQQSLLGNFAVYILDYSGGISAETKSIKQSING